MNRLMPPPATAGLAVVLLAAGTATIRFSLESEANQIGRIRNPAWLPDGKALRLASFGQRLTLADLYWLRLVQYVGERAITEDTHWEALFPLADLVTDLDPRYGYAYQVAGSDLSGLAGRVEESDRILQKGMRNVPDRWSLPFLLAVNKFLYEGKFDEAAFYARRAAEVGGRPHLALLAANLSLVADREDEYRTAASFLEESIRQAETPDLRLQLKQRLAKVRTYETLSRVEKAIAAFRTRFIRAPFALEELVFHGFLAALPADPAGGVLQYDPLSATVRSSALGARSPFRGDR
jgi:enoyl-CoA hydratase/carnithine racemase